MVEPATPLELLCEGLGGNLCSHILPHLKMAAESLDLAADFFTFKIVLDDLAPLSDVDEPWLRLVDPGDPNDKRLAGTLFCSETSFCSNFPLRSGVFPPVEVWDQAPAPGGDGLFESGVFSNTEAALFLHHELLLAQDLARGEVVPATIPSGDIEAFASAWAVVIDGRLARRGLPGYQMAQRRSRFSRLFSSAGVLMPNHWQIFQSLWDGGVSDGKGVLASIRLLPRL
jgi:hypothetical protein